MPGVEAFMLILSLALTSKARKVLTGFSMCVSVGSIGFVGRAGFGVLMSEATRSGVLASCPDNSVSSLKLRVF